jgi:hypothetical protein
MDGKTRTRTGDADADHADLRARGAARCHEPAAGGV